MDEETKKLLKRSVDLGEENNQLLHKIIGFHRWAQIYRVVYWSVIILSTLGAYYFIQPYLETLMGVYTDGANKVEKINDITKNLGDTAQLKELIKSLRE